MATTKLTKSQLKQMIQSALKESREEIDDYLNQEDDSLNYPTFQKISDEDKDELFEELRSLILKWKNTFDPSEFKEAMTTAISQFDSGNNSWKKITS